MERTLNFKGTLLFVMTINNQILFKAKDLSTILEYTRTETALKFLDNDEKLMHLTGETGQQRKTWFVTESGLYHLIIKSTKSEAKKFRKWVTAEILPSIRKAGYYTTDQVSQKQVKLEDIKLLIENKKKAITSKDSELKDLKTQLKELELNFWDIFKANPNQLKLFSEKQMEDLKAN